MVFYSTGPHPSAPLFHHHWRCWQEEDHIQAFHNFHPVLARAWKPPEFIKSCLGGSPTTLPQEPWIWSLDNLSLSRKWMETFGEHPLSINQQLSLIPIGWDFQTIPYWEGPDQWSSQGLHLLILSFRLKHNRGTLKEKPNHILVNPSTSWMDSQSCLLHQWWVWPNQQQLIGAAKSVKHPILSIPQRHPSLLREEPPLVFLQHLSSLYSIQEVNGLQWYFMCARVQWRIGLLVLSLLHIIWTCETWNYVEYTPHL